MVIIVEGTEWGTSQTVQAKKSYKREDIVWDATFAPCVWKKTFLKKGENEVEVQPGCVVDFNNFHELIPAPPE